MTIISTECIYCKRPMNIKDMWPKICGRCNKRLREIEAHNNKVKEEFRKENQNIEIP